MRIAVSGCASGQMSIARQARVIARAPVQDVGIEVDHWASDQTPSSMIGLIKSPSILPLPASVDTGTTTQPFYLYNLAYHCSGARMDAITYSAARANLASVMDRVCDDHEALIITRNGEQSVVMLSLEDYKALEETTYLLRSPANARRLLTAVMELNAGKGTERALVP